MLRRTTTLAAIGALAISTSVGTVAAQSTEATEISTGYGVVVLGTILVLTALTYIVRRSPFAWLAIGLSVSIVGLWFLHAVPSMVVWITFIVNALVVATSGAITKGRG